MNARAITPEPITLGSVRIRRMAMLAPMSGVTDQPIRKQAWRFGAAAVVSEMVACETLAQGRADVVRRMAGGPECGPRIIQLAGREAKWMALGAEIACDAGAEVIDINMGCPARQVTKGLSGSALMRDLDHAQSLIEATVAASRVPVTLKMRLGWDQESLNASKLAQRAEQAGVRMLTVHGRTRQQFYSGQADWSLVRSVREACTLPLVVNGDIAAPEDAREALAASGADRVMVGRASQGRPWLPGAISTALETGGVFAEPDLTTAAASLAEALEDACALYGEALGVRCMRKHLASLVDWAIADSEAARAWRGRICRAPSARETLAALRAFAAAGVSDREAA